MQVVVFNLDDEQFAVETSSVLTITDSVNVIKVPKAPEHIMGLINLRGSIVSLINIRMLLGLKYKKQKSENSNILILNIDGENIGVSVDEVYEVINVEDKEIQKLDDSSCESYIYGILNNSGNIITIIDIQKILENK